MVFNIAQLTAGTSLRDWKPANDETRGKAMRIRANLRAALHDGPLTFNQLKERFDGANILPSLSQMVANGQLIRSGTGGDAKFTLGRPPRRGRPPKSANAGTSNTDGAGARGHRKSADAQPSRRGRPPKSAGAVLGKKGAAPRKTKRGRSNARRTQRLAGGQIAKTIADLLKRRGAIDRAIAALEELARTLR